MKIQEIIQPLETWAPLIYQEDYDNAGWITGDPQQELTGVLLTLDVTEAVVEEAIRNRCNLIIAHHPVVFRGLKRITGASWVERVIILAIKEKLAIYAAHTNLDNMFAGVNGMISDRLGLVNRQILSPLKGTLKKLYTFVPTDQAEKLRNALFAAGAGHIGNYSECSFNAEGKGTFLGAEGTTPFAGQPGQRHLEPETRIETIFPQHLEKAVIKTLMEHHPYEEPAFDLITLDNASARMGAGMIGELTEAMGEQKFLEFLKQTMQARVLRYTTLRNRPVKKVAICGGAGGFLLEKAIGSGADMFITADMTYHHFFDADNQIVIVDIGHYESEQFTVDLFYQVLTEKFPNFAPLKSAVQTNPVNYLI